MNSVQKLATQEGHIHNKIHWHRLHTQWTIGKKWEGKELTRLNSQRQAASEPSQYEMYMEGDNF